jgi:aspartate oxidase
MRNLMRITAATAVLALGVSGANAALLLHQSPTTGEKMVINTETQSETAALAAEGGIAPATCPEGSFYVIEDAAGTTVVECVTEVRYRAVEPGAAAVRVENVPEGAFILEAE